MIIHTNSVRYIWEVYERQEYDFLFKNLRVLDLGCNIGAFSLWIKPLASHIWAVDSEQKYVDKFRETIKDNGLTGIDVIKDRVLDLQDFMSGHSITSIDLLKIDVEGDEYTIFKNPMPKIKTIIGEYHDLAPEERLVALGYRYYEIPGKHFMARLQ